MPEVVNSSATNGKPMRRAFSASDTAFSKPSEPVNTELRRVDALLPHTNTQKRIDFFDTNLTATPGKMKLERALQLKDQCDRELRTICESKRRHYLPRSTSDSHDELLLLEQDKTNETVIRDKRELERLMRKLSPAMSHFASTEAEFVHILQGCSACSNRLAFCAACTEKASEFFSGFSSTELFALYGSDLPPANEIELAIFAEAVNSREARAIRTENADT
ncbi:hypothetical protein JG688_00005284 [Phytophthora aleatoria]|uniref:Uncharacterized protein n=1 Tax=Phytophthora aleatoria TaxID=2496075 RepID=A0A8J5J102_9STRA|nr:hypothetical protein JG688_00005284 [Phytophthora aleatoria]